MIAAHFTPATRSLPNSGLQSKGIGLIPAKAGHSRGGGSFEGGGLFFGGAGGGGFFTVICCTGGSLPGGGSIFRGGASVPLALVGAGPCSASVQVGAEADHTSEVGGDKHNVVRPEPQCHVSASQQGRGTVPPSRMACLLYSGLAEPNYAHMDPPAPGATMDLAMKFKSPGALKSTQGESSVLRTISDPLVAVAISDPLVSCAMVETQQDPEMTDHALHSVGLHGRSSGKLPGRTSS